MPLPHCCWFLSWTLTKVVLQLCFLCVYAAEGFTETKVSCVYRSSCILPCSFRHETDDLHWHYITRTGRVNVHSFYENRDQLDNQDPRFNGRTSLVEDQLTGRKTALMLREVKVQDEGTYKCFVSNHYGYQPFYVVLQVDAPVQNVDMVISGNSITCSSQEVYPKPELTWSSSLQPSSSTVQQTEEKLYNISSSMKLSDMDGDELLNCTISTRFNSLTSTWMKPRTRLHVFLIVPLTGVAAAMVLTCLFCWLKRRKRKTKKQELEEEEEEEEEELEEEEEKKDTTPVQNVDMVTSGNSITCSSEEVYPKPELTWSTSPQSSSTVQQTEEKLYNISSSMSLSDMDGDELLNCTIRTRFNSLTSNRVNLCTIRCKGALRM